MTRLLFHDIGGLYGILASHEHPKKVLFSVLNEKEHAYKYNNKHSIKDIKMNRYEERVLKLLPKELAEASVKAAGLNGGFINEIRLRLNKPLVVTINDDNVNGWVKCTREHMEYTVKALCANSMYSHFNTIREGYIDAGGGIRAGICGQAVAEQGKISAVKDITSVSIRIPRRVIGSADPIYDMIREMDYRANVLIYSKPGMGKTTLLRELAVKLSSGPYAKRTAIVDTRSELSCGMEDAFMADVLSGYPRSLGIETAVRTLSPQYVICDEIMTSEDADAILTAVGSGVSLCASIHADSYDALVRQPIVKKLNDYGAFNVFVGLIPVKDREKRYALEITKAKGADL